MRRLNDLKSLGAAWAAKTLAEDNLAAWQRMQKRFDKGEIRIEPSLKSYGDRPICACGKVDYATKREAVTVAKETGRPLRPYICPLGHPVYHLKSPRSERRGGLR